MKYVDEFRDAAAARGLAARIAAACTRPWKLMEVCGGQTHSIVRFGLDRLLPAGLELVHGPGCPVCVTPVDVIDQALELAARPDVVLASFGDMLRVPGSDGDLLRVKAAGGDVRVVYSPLDCLELARADPDRQVVFFAVGFETTAPANAMLAWQARARGVRNLSLLVSQVLVPPALDLLMGDPASAVDAYLAPGHVCTVMGVDEYQALVARRGVPIVVTGFEPLDILQGVLAALVQLERGEARLENQYARTVRTGGNPVARDLLARVFRVADRKWRGIGVIPRSGLELAEEFRDLDAAARFGVAGKGGAESPDCVSGRILLGLLKPPDCPAFGSRCTPDHPLGATMVSSEGACAAYYRYRREEAP